MTSISSPGTPRIAPVSSPGIATGGTPTSPGLTRAAPSLPAQGFSRISSPGLARPAALSSAQGSASAKSLLNAEVFATIPLAELRQVASLLRSVARRPGELLATRGQPLAGMLVVEEGALEVQLDSAPLCTLSPGSIFCEDALLLDARAPATVRTVCSSRVAFLDRAALSAQLGQLPQLRRALETAWRKRVLAACLYKIDLFQALSAEARALLLERFERVELPPGSVLAEEGEQGDTFSFIRSGEAQLHLDPPLADPHDPFAANDPALGADALDRSEACRRISGPSADAAAPARPSTMAPLLAGDYLGETSLFDDAPQTATVTTAAGLTAMQLTRAQLEDVLGALPGQLAAARRAFARRSESFF